MLTKCRQFLTRLHQDESGAMSVEKILIIALIALPLLIILYLFRNKIIGYFQDQTQQLDQDVQSGTSG